MEELLPKFMKNIIHLDEIDSTNTFAVNLLSKTNPIDGTVIRSDFQTLGRGQIGRYWHSERAKNLLFSIILYPTFVKANEQFILSKAISIGVVEFIQALKIKDVTIKWPNDIYIGDKKVAGILIQNQILGKNLKSTVVGIGLNVNQSVWPDNLPNPISLSSFSDTNLDLDALLSQVINCIEKWYRFLVLNKLTEIDRKYKDLLYLKSIKRIFYKDNVPFEGTIIGVDMHGHLLIKDNHDKCQSFGFREISFFQ